MQSRGGCELPAELWSKILRFATLEDNVNEEDQDLILHPNSSHQRSISNKRAVVSVCRRWREWAIEYLWESVGNFNQSQLVELGEFLKKDKESARTIGGGGDALCAPQQALVGGSGTDALKMSVCLPRGWWIRSLVTRFDFGDEIDTFVAAITAIFPFCPNLISFTHIHDHNGPLPASVISSLAECCGRTLIRFQLDWGGVNIDDLLHLLDQSSSLQHVALGCTFDPPSSNLLPPEIQQGLKRDFHFDKLRSLQFGNIEDGMIRRFNSHLLEAASWNMPALTAVVIDLDARTSIDEVVGFLQAHGKKLKTLSLTESGRTEGIPISWNEIFTLCPQIIELRMTFNPFANFNMEAFTSNLQPSDPTGFNRDPNLIPVLTPTEDLPELPRLITSPIATQLQRLCFDKWEFFPGMDCVMNNTHHGGPLASQTTEENFLKNVFALLDKSSLSGSATADDHDEKMLLFRERSERLLLGYRRVLDSVFGDFGRNLVPALSIVQFDFNAGRLDLPNTCCDWWNGWISEWRKRGLQVEGCRRIPI